MSTTGKKIPITAAKGIAADYGYSQVIIHAFDRASGIQHVTTYGKSEADCINAAQGGNTMKKLLRWPEEQCNAKPARQIRRERYDGMEQVMAMLVSFLDHPDNDDRIALARLVGIATVAKNLSNPKAKGK
ncbi:MAG: hypothetical protein JWO03_915 [Bacteroidetes bacterium]|nr:hypothetical protein [Bacteroidota bacterium]